MLQVRLVPQETKSEMEISVQEVYWGDALGLITSGKEGKEASLAGGEVRFQCIYN